MEHSIWYCIKHGLYYGGLPVVMVLTFLSVLVASVLGCTVFLSGWVDEEIGIPCGIAITAIWVVTLISTLKCAGVFK